MENEPAILAVHPWMTDVINYFRKNVDILTEAPQTLITENYLFKEYFVRRGYRLSGGLGVGCIRSRGNYLASIIEARKDDVVARITESYILARFKDDDFDKAGFRKTITDSAVVSPF